MRTSPRAKRKKPPRQAKLVQVIPLRKDDCVAVIRQNGTVIPAQQVTLQPQVAGQIVELSPDVVPGCRVEAGEKLVAIDPRDYEIAVQQAQSTVAMAEKDLKLERGNQAVARQEYELLGDVIADEDRELVLREPQLASAQAALKSAQAALKKSQINLARCEISAPFNAIVQHKHVDLGATVATNSQLVTLIGRRMNCNGYTSLRATAIVGQASRSAAAHGARSSPAPVASSGSTENWNPRGKWRNYSLPWTIRSVSRPKTAANPSF